MPLACIVLLPLAPARAAAEPAASGEPWEKVYKAGSDALDRGQFGVAERLLQQALVKSAAFGQSDLRFARSLGEMGRYYCVRGRFSEAEPMLEEELHARELSADSDLGEIVPVMGAMVGFYLEHGTVSKADPLADKMLAFVQGKMIEIKSVDSPAAKFEKGKPLTAWAGTAAAAMQAPVIEWAIACDAVGNAYRARRDFYMAEKFYKAALEVKETVLGKKHLSLANSYDSLGMLSQERQEQSEAEDYFRDALEHTERILPPDNPQVFARLDKLARCLTEQKKYGEAEGLYLRAQDFFKGKQGQGCSQARACYALGSLYVTEQKYAAAAPVLSQALRLAETCHGPESIALVPYLKRLADAMYHLGQARERSQLKARADTIAGVSPR